MRRKQPPKINKQIKTEAKMESTPTKDKALHLLIPL
jgi:hypothetical protein